MANTKITNPELFNLGDSTSATQLPVMTTTERIAMNAAPTLNVDYLVVAGGGGGGGNQSATGGGGGAGGLRTSYGSSSGGGSNAENSLTFNLPTSYTITVGDGGTLGSGTTAPTNGGNSSITGSDITNVTSLGGGAADNSTLLPPQTGGSGGGGGNGSYAGASGEPNQGYAGGNSQSGARGAGGGGAANVGANSTNNNGGAGGSGLSVNILSSANANVEGVGEVSGSSVYYAGGGGGGSAASGASSQASGGIGGGGNGEWSNGNNASAGTANTGGGGGGAFTDGAKNGGSGVVILRYVTADVTGYTTTGSTPIEVIENDYTVLVFKTVGTGTITFTSSTPTGTISTGEMIFNSDTDKVEYFDGTKWYGITYEAAFPAGVQIAYSANDTASYPGTGTTWFDISGNSNDATLTNTTYSNGYLSFNGSSSKVTTSYTANPQNASFAAWVNCNNVSTYNNFISKGFYSGGSNTNYVFLVNYADARPKLAVRLNGNQRDCQSSVAMTNNTWHHVVGTVSSTGDMKIYLDGTQTGSQTGAPARNMTQSILSGVYLNGNQQFFSGEISKIQVYDTVLTATDVTDLYNAGSGTT